MTLEERADHIANAAGPRHRVTWKRVRDRALAELRQIEQFHAIDVDSITELGTAAVVKNLQAVIDRQAKSIADLIKECAEAEYELKKAVVGRFFTRPWPEPEARRK